MDRTLLDNNLSTELLQTITVEQAWHYRIIPIKGQNGTLQFFIDEEMDVYEFKQELELIFDDEVELFPAKKDEISKSLGKHYLRKKGGSKTSNGKLDFTNEEFLAQLISEAKSIGSSDIHIETYEERCRIRMRIDGKLIERYVLEKDDYPAIVNKIKIKANLDIAEKRLPQDGRIFYSEEKEKTDLRVSVLPTLHGEKVVLRLLNRDATEIDISLLGFSQKQESNYSEAIKKPYGIILISGPTGSGKTTTLYATLKILNKVQTNILKLEDPIEYTLVGINQVQLPEDIG